MNKQMKSLTPWLGMAAILLLAAGSGQARSAQDRFDHYIYVESGDAPNSIIGFRRDSEGQLTPTPGSPYATGGDAIVDPSIGDNLFDTPDFTENDQIITVDRERQLLFAANSHSETIAVFHINPFDGSLWPVLGSPFPSGGVTPISLGVRGDQLVIVNQDEDPAIDDGGVSPNIVTRHILPSGQIVPLLSDTTTALPSGTDPTQVLVANVRPFVFVMNRIIGALASWQLHGNGELRANPEQTLPVSVVPAGAAHRGAGLWANPVARELYVGFATVNKVGVYTWDNLGNPVFQTAVPLSGALDTNFRANRDGTRLYASDSGNFGGITPTGATGTVPAKISVLDTTNPAAPVEIQAAPVSGLGRLFQIEIDPSGEFLYALSERATPNVPEGEGNNLHVFSISAVDGTLTEVPSSPFAFDLPLNVRPQGIAAF